MKLYADRLPGPLGDLLAAVDDRGALVRLAFDAEREAARLETAAREGRVEVVWDSGRCDAVRAQLDEYFDGTRRVFDLEVEPDGTDFQKAVWTALRRVPYGETISYGELARRVGRPDAARAVGRANGTNPVPIVVPCHRVIGADGSLTGYGGGIEIKKRLLALERGQLQLL